MPNRRIVFFVSDRTGITAEMLGNSLLSQFDDIEFQRLTIPFVDSSEKIAAVIEQVNETTVREGRPPIVFSSIVDEAMSDTLRRHTNALTLDLFQTFIAPLESALGAKSSIFRRRTTTAPRPATWRGHRSSWSGCRGAARRPRRSTSRCNSASGRPIFR
jgi:regulator of PEP synthase PpsR (kinase-PPPase family)